MSAFGHAWDLLKAIPGQQGYMGTLPPAVLQMLARRRAEAGEEGLGPTGEPLPATDRRVERDLSPLREMQQTMISQRDAEEMAGDTQSMGVTSAPSMANVRGYDTMPEESFYSPREQRLAREGMEQSAGRQLTGGQRGGRTNIRGGSGAGMNLPLRGVDDEGKRMRPGSRRRRATTLQNVEGVGTGARFGGASREFVDQPEEPRKPTQQETIANILSGMATAAGGTFEDKTPPREAKPTKERPLRQMSNRYRENLERVRQGEKPDLNVPMDEETMGMFRDPASAESQAIRERLMQFAGQQGRFDGSTRQNQIDRAA